MNKERPYTTTLKMNFLSSLFSLLSSLSSLFSSLSVSVFFHCLSLSLCLCVSVSICLCFREVLWSCCCGVLCCVVVCGVVCATPEKSVCPLNTSPCVPLHTHTCFNMCAWCRHTRGRFEYTHGGRGDVLSGHTFGVFHKWNKLCFTFLEYLNRILGSSFIANFLRVCVHVCVVVCVWWWWWWCVRAMCALCVVVSGVLCVCLLVCVCVGVCVCVCGTENTQHAGPKQDKKRRFFGQQIDVFFDAPKNVICSSHLLLSFSRPFFLLSFSRSLSLLSSLLSLSLSLSNNDNNHSSSQLSLSTDGSDLPESQSPWASVHSLLVQHVRIMQELTVLV